MTWLTFLIVCSLVAFACGARGSNWEDKRLVHVHAAAADMPEEWRGYVRIGTEPLGTGNFGEAWLARDASSNQQVVVKFFFVTGRPGVFLSPSTAILDDLQDARNECQAPRSILQETKFPTPNYVVDCIANGVDDSERSYIVLEVAGSQTLGQYMTDFHSRQTNVTARVRIYKVVAKMLLEGLREFEGFYVHRDIKPANIMVSKGTDGEPQDLKFIDWGLAVRENFSGLLAGDPDFLPPETKPGDENMQWGRTMDRFTFHARHDVYAVGEMLFSYVCQKEKESQPVTWRRRVKEEMIKDNRRQEMINYALRKPWTKTFLEDCNTNLENELLPLWELIKVMRLPISSTLESQKLRPLASKILVDFATLLEVKPNGQRE